MLLRYAESVWVVVLSTATGRLTTTVYATAPYARQLAPYPLAPVSAIGVSYVEIAQVFPQ